MRKAHNHHLNVGGYNESFSDFTFVQAADCQLGMEFSCKGAWGYGKGRGYEDDYKSNATWDNEIRWCTSFVNMVNRLEPKPKFAVICGDILDAWPAHLPDVRTKQYTDFVRIMEGLQVPLVCVCGNHDVGNHPTASTVQRYRTDFGDDWFTFIINRVFFIVVNSQYFEFGQKVPEITSEHERWLDAQLAEAKSGKYVHSVMFQHIPFFIHRPDEPKIYYTFTEGIRERLLRKIADAGVSKVFCGHYHRNGGGWYGDSLEVIVTSAIGLQQGQDRNGFRVVDVTRDGISHKYVTLDNIDVS